MRILTLQPCPRCSELQAEQMSRCRACGQRLSGRRRVRPARKPGAALLSLLIVVLLVSGYFWLHPSSPITSALAPRPVVLRDPNDPRSTYRLIAWRQTSRATAEALVQRDGASGRSFSRRRVDCRTGRTRSLGAGDSLSETAVERPDAAEVTHPSGTIWAQAADLACRRRAAGSRSPS